MTNKEKSDKVKYWIKSYVKGFYRFIENESRLVLDEFMAYFDEIEKAANQGKLNQEKIESIKKKFTYTKKKAKHLLSIMETTGFVSHEYIMKNGEAVKEAIKEFMASGEFPSS